jgi:arylsulfatase A-like enzyme
MLRRGLYLVPAALVAVVLLIAFYHLLAPSCPPQGRPTRTTGSAPVSLATTPPTAEELRASLKDANLVLVVIDDARADHLGCYGYPRETTPNIDRIAQESVVFEQHFSQFPHTRPSTTSLFTGQYPDTHGVRSMFEAIPNGFTLVGALKAAGFETAFISGSAIASPAMGLGEDFEYVSARTLGPRKGVRKTPARRDPEQVLGELSRWLKDKEKKRFFAYIHFLPPHQPYEAPAEMQRLFAHAKPPYLWKGRFVYPEIEPVYKSKPKGRARDEANLYDANLRYADWGVGEVEKLLAKNHLLDSTLLIITSDHGEAFGEHGYLGHREGLYDEHVHIPLLVRFPGGEAPVGRVRALSETVDILPTVLDLFALPFPTSVQGRSLVPLITGERRAVHDFVFARAEGSPETYLVRDQSWAMILFKGGKLRALYDLEHDPWQTRNVIGEQPQEARRLSEGFRRFAEMQSWPPLDFIDPDYRPRAKPRGKQPEMSEDLKKELKALGYLK